MNLLPIGTRVRSLRTSRIVGTVQGYGTLLSPRNVDNDTSLTHPIVVYLVWNEQSPGSNSLIDPTVHVLDVGQVEEQP